VLLSHRPSWASGRCGREVWIPGRTVCLPWAQHLPRGEAGPAPARNLPSTNTIAELGSKKNELLPAEEERKRRGGGSISGFEEGQGERRATGTVCLCMYIHNRTFCRGKETRVTDGVKILAAYPCWGTTAVATPRETTAATLLPSTWGGQ